MSLKSRPYQRIVLWAEGGVRLRRIGHGTHRARFACAVPLRFFSVESFVYFVF